MHCDKCNIDFPEGLHYCKWCGEALVDHARITSELHTCPSCAVAVQPAWTFCKACGERLQNAASEPASNACPECGARVEPGARKCPRCNEYLTARTADQIAQDSSDTAVISKCPSCGESVEAGTLYCKACGSAVYTQQTPFGDSALLCGACKSYSPFGSRMCRVCGAHLTQAAQTVVDRPAFVPERPPTFVETPAKHDADDHGADEHSSDANTIAFGRTERTEEPVTGRPKPSVQTSVLPGTAGSRSEQQSTTSIVQMGRITGPVEGEIQNEESASSGALENTVSGDDDRAAGADLTKEMPALLVESLESSTSGLGSQSVVSPAEAKGGTEAFASPVEESPPARFDHVAQDNIHTREFAPPSPPDQGTPTRVQQAWTEPVPNESAGVPVSEKPLVGVTREIASAGITTLPVDEASSQPLPKKRTGVLVASAVVALIIILGAAVVGYWLLFGHGRGARQPAQPVVEQPRPAPEPPPAAKPTAPIAPEGMLAVAAGSYAIGRDGADPLEQPEHKADLPAFFIDRTEVTNAAYKKFVDATGHKPPTNWNETNSPDQHGNFPVTGVTWQDAVDYAAWAGKRLPTEAEWEAAARGTDGRIYPWGNQWRAGLANIGSKPDDITAEQYPAGIKEVGQYPQGASPAGAVDMIGNAWEWVEDEITIYPGNTDTRLPLKPGLSYRVIRGGAYDGNKVHDATYRGFLDASQAYPKVGFRCAKDAK